MLSPDDQRRLAAIEEQLLIDDPAFARRLARAPNTFFPDSLNKVSSTAIVSAAPAGRSRATIKSARANPSASPDQRALVNNRCARL